MRMNLKAALAASALVGMGFVAACADSATAPASGKFVSEVNLAVGDLTNSTPEFGKIKICKTGNAGGSFDVTRTSGNGAVSGLNTAIANATCRVVAEDFSTTGGSQISQTEDPVDNTVSTRTACSRIDATAGNPVTSCAVTSNPTTADVRFLNNFHGFVITYNNTFTPPPPPPAICDFITFGRLVTEIGGEKVVISGNVGGNNADGSIKNEFQIKYLGVTYHVADAVTYGPIAAGPLNSVAFPNSRVVTGIAKNGVAVELRLWDGGEPGKDTDKVWFRLGSSPPGYIATVGGANGQFIDQGNMQYHSNCRGPG